MPTFTENDVKNQAIKNAAKSATPGWWKRFWCEHDFEEVDTPCVSLETGETVMGRCVRCGHTQWFYHQDLPPKMRKPHIPPAAPPSPYGQGAKSGGPLFRELNTNPHPPIDPKFDENGNLKSPPLHELNPVYRTVEEYNKMTEKGVQKLRDNCKNPPPEPKIDLKGTLITEGGTPPPKTVPIDIDTNGTLVTEGGTRTPDHRKDILKTKDDLLDLPHLPDMVDGLALNIVPSSGTKLRYTNAAKQAIRKSFEHSAAELRRIAKVLCIQRNGSKITFEDIQNAQRQMFLTRVMDDVAITLAGASIAAYTDVAMEVRDEYVKTFRNKLTEAAEAACMSTGRNTVTGKHVIMALNKIYRNYEVQDLQAKVTCLRTDNQDLSELAADKIQEVVECTTAHSNEVRGLESKLEEVKEQYEVARDDRNDLADVVVERNREAQALHAKILELLKELKFYSLRKNYKWVGEPIIPFDQPAVLQDNGKKARSVIRDNKKKKADDGHTEKG